MAPRSLDELLQALGVADASAVLFGRLPVTSPETTTQPPPARDSYAAFSESQSISVTLEECLLLRVAGARDGRPTFQTPATKT